jgi:hypothetical protein
VTEDERDCYIEMWKQTIEVQKHFNDIELRIRGLALTVLTFVLGGASLAVRNGTTVSLNGFRLQQGTLILALGILLWLTFYFVDQIWYHRLLIGAVVHGEKLEDELRKVLPVTGLTHQISKSSPYLLKISIAKRTLWKYELHSKQKLSFFYWFIAGLLALLAIIIQLTVQPLSHPSSAVKSPGPSPTATVRPSSSSGTSVKSPQPSPSASVQPSSFTGPSVKSARLMQSG